MQRFIFFILIFLLLMGLVSGGIFVWGFAQYIKPGPTISKKTVYISKGLSVDSIANILENEGIIDDAMIFSLGVRLSRVEKMLKAGEFEFSNGISAKGAAELLIKGKTVTRRLTIAEGLTAFQVFDQLDFH